MQRAHPTHGVAHAKSKARPRTRAHGRARRVPRQALPVVRSTRARLARLTTQASRIVSRLGENVQFLRGLPKISNEQLRGLLSQFLAVEQSGVELYAIARDRSPVPDIQAVLEKYLQQSRRHITILQQAIRNLGGNPSEVSPLAEIELQRARSFVELEVPSELHAIVDIENIVLAETKDHANWSFLRSILPLLEKQKTQGMLAKIIEQVESEEDDHVAWAKATLNRLMLEQMTHREIWSEAA